MDDNEPAIAVTIMSRAVNDLVTLPAFLFLLMVGLGFMWRRPVAFAPRVFVTVVAVVYALLAIPLMPYIGARLLASGYRPFTPSPDETIRAIVVLGAGVETVEGADHQQLALLDSVGAERTLEAARVYRALNHPWVISSGGSRDDVRPSSAAAMASALIRLGIRADRIVQEDRSITTHDQAVLIAPMLRQLNAERFVLVTTRSHMPRSEAVFRAQRLDPLPAIVPDDIQLGRLSLFLVPDVDGLKSSRALLHELGGLLYYRARGFM